jgi:hypothetical protein
MGDEGEDEGGEQRGQRASGAEAKTVGTRTPRNEGGHGDGQEVKEEAQLCRCGGGAQSGQEQAAATYPVPGLTGSAKGVSEVGDRSSQAGADQREGDGGHRNDKQAPQQRLGRRARAPQAGIDERQAGEGQGREQQ